MKRIVLTIMLMLGFSLGAYANDNTPEGVILAYMEALKKGDLEKAKSYLDEKSFTRTDKKGRVKNETNKQVEGDYRTLKYGASDISQWTFKIEKKDDIENSYRIYLINPTSEFESTRTYGRIESARYKKINGKWKIISKT